ncbi:MAG TPA: C40 family peptidase [Mycobacterium sp.]|nr:C40 family peptidase [Mycobacterium sp.]
MSASELAVLNRAHQLFAASTRAAPLDGGLAQCARLLDRAAALNTGAGQQRYRLAVHTHREALRSTTQTDATVAGVVAAAQADHAWARERTKNVVDEARADASATPDTALAQREAMRRRVARLRAQQAHVLSARRRALQHRAALRGLRYRNGLARAGLLAGVRLPPPNSRAGRAVRAALSRLGRPYVWGATGPNQFDCSGLTQWAYAQAGVHLDRTTYQQIHDGIPVPRSHIRPGDLVFPSAGHVQLAIGSGLVIEAPHAGAAVQISPLGSQVAVRRPVP